MSIDRIRAALTRARQTDQKVDLKELDALMVEARDGGGIDATERAELVKAADGFDDAVKQRLLTHLAATGQKNGFVNVEVPGRVTDVKGRYATLSTNVPGLNSKLGLFDNVFSLSGKPKADGRLTLTVEGQAISVEVKKGEAPALIMERVARALPPQVTGLVLSGDVQPYDPETFEGPSATLTDKAAHLAMYKPESLGLRTGEKPLRVVVTGYGAFGGITDNPSAAMAQRLAEQGVPGAIVEYQRLDVTHPAVDSFINDMRRQAPDVILSMGVSSWHAQLEEQPENRVGSGRDGNDRPISAGVVRRGAPDVLRTDLPVKTIDDALKPFGAERQVGTSLSDASYAPDRSAYLCNYLGYNLANAFGAIDATTAGFVHITSETPTPQMYALFQALVARQLDWRRAQPGRPVS